MFNKKEFGRRLAETRKKAGYKSASAAAEAVAKKIPSCPETRSSLSKWESGTQTKTFEQLEGICETLGVSADYLLFGVESEQLDINKFTGLTAGAIGNLQKLRAEDSTGYKMAAINRILSSEKLLQALASFMDIKSKERGYFDATCSPENGLYQVTMSPDSFAQVLLFRITHILESIRNGQEESLPSYEPMESLD